MQFGPIWGKIGPKLSNKILDGPMRQLPDHKAFGPIWGKIRPEHEANKGAKFWTDPGADRSKIQAGYEIHITLENFVKVLT